MFLLLTAAIIRLRVSVEIIIQPPLSRVEAARGIIKVLFCHSSTVAVELLPENNLGATMGAWKGLDPGGTEQLWDEVVLFEALQTFKLHEPFSRVAPASPIFDELEDKFPEITWRNVNVDGFRPVFRKTNPWVKLGLISPNAHPVYVTPLGEELLSGEKTIAQIFIEATRNFTEADGTPSFALVCRAALAQPNHTFTLEDLEYALSKVTPSEFVSALQNVRDRGYLIPSRSRRRRTLRSFMNALSIAGALAKVADGWKLFDTFAAQEIAGAVNEAGLSRASIVDAYDAGFLPITPGARTMPSFDMASLAPIDPIKRQLLLEKATTIHEGLVEHCAAEIRDSGDFPIEDRNSFDVAVVQLDLIIEVKSITPANVVAQLRKGVVQLLEYRWRHRNTFSAAANLVIIVDQDPRPHVDVDFLLFIASQGISLFWRNTEQMLIDSTNQRFTNYLAQLQLSERQVFPTFI